MTVENLLQVVEKDRMLTGMDKRSAVHFLNDGLRKIYEMQSIESEEIIDSFDDTFIQPENEIIRLNHIMLADDTTFVRMREISNGSFTNAE